jgi:hypothetical protein
VIAWGSFIGNFVGHIVSKISAKLPAPTSYDRKGITMLFLDLYEAVTRLEGASLDFLMEADTVINGIRLRLYRRPLANIAREAEEASRLFESSFQCLPPFIRSVELWLPMLPKQVAQASLLMKKMKFELRPNPNSVFFIDYSAPSMESMKANIVERSFPDNSEHEIRYLNEIVASGYPILTSTKEHLLTFIRKNFSLSLEDFIYDPVHKTRGSAKQ